MVALTRPERRLRAMSLRRKPSSAIAFTTRSTSGWATAGSLLTTRETVLRLTPAWRATSTIVGRRGPAALTPVRAIATLHRGDHVGTTIARRPAHPCRQAGRGCIERELNRC